MHARTFIYACMCYVYVNVKISKSLFIFYDFAYWNCIKVFSCGNLFNRFLNSIRWSSICWICFTIYGFRKVCTFFFLDANVCKYTFILPYPTVSGVIFNISWIIFNIIYQDFALHQQKATYFSLFVNVDHCKWQ